MNEQKEHCFTTEQKNANLQKKDLQDNFPC